MTDAVATHYFDGEDLAAAIAARLREAGKSIDHLTTADLAPIDEFHIRGRAATLELAEGMGVSEASDLLDIGSGLGGPARTLAETYGCHVTGVDLTPAYCQAATTLSQWVGLEDRVAFHEGDATDLPFTNDRFDAAMTIHVAMNIADKAALYREAKRVVKPGGAFAVYDVLQGEGGDVRYPVPWARDASISFLATPDEMQALLTDAGFQLSAVQDSSEAGEAWFAQISAAIARSGPPPLTFQTFLGADFPAMARNQVQNLAERRIRTVTYICRA